MAHNRNVRSMNNDKVLLDNDFLMTEINNEKEITKFMTIFFI